MKINVHLYLIFIIISTGCAVYPHGDEDHEKHLHFEHPLITETPSPDTKIRFDYGFTIRSAIQSGFNENNIRFEFEYAFSPSISIEVNLPYTWISNHPVNQNNLSNTEIGLKVADFRFEDNNLLIGYGVDFSMPTGNEGKNIGSSHLWNIEPGLSAGYKLDNLEIIFIASTGIPFNSTQGEVIHNDLSLNSSFLYHIDKNFQGIVEFSDETILNGEEKGISSIIISPGIKLTPLNNKSLAFGLSTSFPMSTDREFEIQALFSIFYHL